MDACVTVIPLPLPRGHFPRDQGLAVQSAVQTFAVPDADLRFRPVQPTALLGRIGKRNPVQQPPGLCGPEGLLETGAVVRVQGVLHQPDVLRLRG